MVEKILGLDIGISSVGWAVVNYDKNLTKKEDFSSNEVIKSGVRIFTIAENPKTGASLALPRRLARGTRKTIKRKTKRLKAIKLLCIKYLNLSKDDLFSKEHSIFNSKNRTDVWQLRDKGLKRKLTNIELARVLVHIAKRRGYKSNRKVDEGGNTEGKKVLSAIENNNALLDNYLTIGQAIYQSTKISHIRRNKIDDYNHSISRDMLEKEINIIFKKQKLFENTLINENFKKEYIDLFVKQKDFASVDKMIGFCILEGKKEKRAAKAAYSSEEFVTLTKLINTKIVNNDDKERLLNEQELNKILLLCKQKEYPTYINIRDTINLEEKSYFKGIDLYEINKKTGEVTKKATKFVSGFKAFHELRKLIEKKLSKIHWANLSSDKELLNELGTIFSYHKSDEKIKNELEKINFKSLNKEEKLILIDTLIENISFNKFLNLSIKAIDKLLEKMILGKRYDEAVKELNYKKIEFKKEKFLRALNKDEQLELTNPVVKRAFAQTRKVINALIRKYGQFDKVHIELTREIKKSREDRNKIKKGQEEFQTMKKSIVNKFIEDYGREPKGNELLKFRLLQEQDGYCAYSGYKGKEGYIDLKRLLEQGYVEIDHILPLSRSLEDGMHNKVLCLSRENQNKKNRTPYEYFTNTKKDWDKYETWINSLKNIKKPKRYRLLKKNFDENSEKEFRERNANDTAFMAKFIKSFIQDNLELKSSDKNKVISINGMLTNMLRYNWQVGDKDRKNHLHHAVDAIIIAFATQSEVQRLSTVSAKNKEFIYRKVEEKTKKIKFNAPVKDFRNIIQKSIDDIFVSFAPRKGITGEAHEQTIYSPHDFKANKKQKKKSFLTGGSVIRNVKLNNESKIAKQSIMPRIDIFKSKENGKYYVVPIYISDFIKLELPNKAIVTR